MWNWELGLLLVCLVRIFQFEIQFFLHTAGDNYRHLCRMVYLGVTVTVMVSVSGSETYFVITKLSLCLTFSLIRTRATSLDSQLLGIDMQRNQVNKWAWRKRFRFSTTFCVPLWGVSAVYEGVSAYRERFALELARTDRPTPCDRKNRAMQRVAQLKNKCKKAESRGRRWELPVVRGRLHQQSSTAWFLLTVLAKIVRDFYLLSTRQRWIHLYFLNETSYA